MKILIACEFSGVVRDAFAKLGHEAWSCDLLPSELPGNHYQCDLFDVLSNGWDMVIAHPPCTYLAVSGNRWYHDSPLRTDAIKFVERIWQTDVQKMVIENPVGVLSTRSILGKPTQYIHPWQFGHWETKKTCLWLRGVEPLEPTAIVYGPYENRIWRMAPSDTRSMERSRTYQGWAEAMAQQWGELS